jgi:hypothetical protein
MIMIVPLSRFPAASFVQQMREPRESVWLGKRHHRVRGHNSRLGRGLGQEEGKGYITNEEGSRLKSAGRSARTLGDV